MSLHTIKTPFKYDSDIYKVLKEDLQKIKRSDQCIFDLQAHEHLNTLYKWLCMTPKNTTFRVNTLKSSTKEVMQHIENVVEKLPAVSTFPELPELIMIHTWDKSEQINLDRCSEAAIVDAKCASAILRGSHIFAPGIIGIPHGLNIGDKISIYADITGECKKGLIKPYNDEKKLFLGNGIIKQTREELFRPSLKTPSGIAVRMTDTISRLPQVSDESVPEGSALLQNLPSIICSRVLDPKPGETILDMCAAPGNKTTHISQLMNSQGLIIALEKNKAKLERLIINCNKFNATNVKIFCFDSTKAVSAVKDDECIIDTPPYTENSFDRILLDGPCSALGQRPQILNKINAAQLKSYVPLQRKLFSTAVRLLKNNGTLVYSTCTITVAENEGIVSWALKTFPCLRLSNIPNELQQFGTKGYEIDGLTKEESAKLLRFGPESDTVGFFIARFVKHC